jgi:nucleotide-binding universal stress UspA family protein
VVGAGALCLALISGGSSQGCVQGCVQRPDYLEIQLDRAREAGITATAEVCHGRISEQIVTVANDRRADLIVLATHGKAGVKAFWDNSVAVDVQTRTVKPLLLVPV